MALPVPQALLALLARPVLKVRKAPRSHLGEPGVAASPIPSAMRYSKAAQVTSRWYQILLSIQRRTYPAVVESGRSLHGPVPLRQLVWVLRQQARQEHRQ